MPWLREVLESAPAQLSFHERRALLQETKRGWALAEQVRAKLNELVSELLLSAAPSQQLSVVGR
jgi:predicted metal-dependent enzyme (double-stranded beta helix superfamily)